MRTIIVFLILSNTFSASAAETFNFPTHAREPVSSFLGEILREAFRPCNINATIEEMPGRKVIKMVNSGIADGDPCRVRNFRQISDDDTSNYVLVDEPVVLIEVVIVTHRDTVAGEPDWAWVNQGKVLYLRGSKRIRKNIEEQNQIPADNLQEALNLVRLKRYRSMVLFKSEAEWEFQNHPDLKNDLIIHQKPLMGYNMYVYLHKKHLNFVPVLEQSLKKLKSEGRFRQIGEKYFVSMPVPGKD